MIAANIVATNLPNIEEVKGENLRNIDLLSYSFPCQGLSIANMGRGQGMKPNSTSTSSLVWEIHRIINEAEKANVKLPKYLLLENVVNLMSKKHKSDYEKWTNFLKSKGYETKTMILNGINHRSIQKRRRVLAISILGSKDKTPDKKFQDLFIKKFGKKLSENARNKKYHQILSSSDNFPDEIKIAIPNATPSRFKMLKENSDLLKRDWKKQDSWTFRTLTTKQDRHPNIGMISLSNDFLKEGKLSKRFVTHREAYQIMGFNSNDFGRVKLKLIESILTSETLYRQAGNSIIVTVLEDVLKFIANYERGLYESKNYWD